MQSSIIAVVFLIPLASSTFSSNNCKNSSSCPEGCSCVQGCCFDCTLEPVKCLRSIEICASLKCASDESCYLKQEVDYGSHTATVKTVCSKTDPCAEISCANGCITVTYGDQPPVGKCLSENTNPCKGYKCPDGYKCYVKTSYAYGLPGRKEASCADMSECEDGCGFLKYCATRMQPDGTIKGVCSWSLTLFD